MHNLVPLMLALVLLGCDSEQPIAPSTESGQPSDQATAGVGADSAAQSSEGKSFGIDNTFSGKLSGEQERVVPKALRGAFTIESLQPITADGLDKELEMKTQVAEEIRDGKRYVALQDFRHVQFSDEVSGEMIVIERYVVTPE